ncbi:tol-pal system protein YbgF [Amphibiibacter pelophylacis]|uniref:Tol-pal system protein YbgF n=1 Tax=Amphibiibacter pelophylacis TaxID=1799477 RepID=A0ACC6P4F3_9BURK
MSQTRALLPSPTAAARRARWRSTLVAGALLALGTGSAWAQLFDDSEARKAIIALRGTVVQQGEQIQAESTRLQGLIDQLQRSLLQTSSAQDALRGELAQLRGDNEVLQRTLDETQTRLQALEKQVGDTPQPTGTAALTPPGTPAPVFEPPQDAQAKAAYDQALSKFRSRDFAGAMTDFNALIKTYPQSSLAPQAQFWLGNAHYALGRMKPAISVLNDFVARNPQSASAPDALLTVAEAQIGSGDTAGGKATLDRLIKTYPQSKASTLARDRLGAIR